MIDGFRKFIARGNAIDLAVGVIMGAAFSAIVTSLTQDILMPLIAAIFGQPDFKGQFVLTVGSGQLQFGNFITALINFFLVAFALYFFVVLPINKVKDRMAKAEEAAGTEEKPADPQVVLLEEIRDELRSANRQDS
ncbi:large conductance mechanosensitive channel [Actinobaculum suis]|uniref:Large-conductance mechanosensitive channel n=1 Tax=Actinobaculum suis TaxID=1657 RepID=A0A0K9ETZ5_9ACTO|nr:large conductance mechanosensitive channel protein MscL [Actinobaculum suis]KMY23669.1 mechanosensitive ion channel protein MscL [Actinobaculum suis]MDY5153007.1 large conductance mechanosensitive channel protein MscL [Actinobaculum suis]SDE66628.1 large conductance mechanosensitive channel [Actinobaculum suis]VDG77042.1 large-conductance mechanosensitive channel [Actinobaculum suis]